MTRRILVLSASVGAGHLRAAQAVELALRQLDPTAVVKNVDVLELTNAAFRGLYGKAYLDLVPAADTTVSGIPIHPVFSEPKDRATVLKRHSLRGDRPSVLQLAGGLCTNPPSLSFSRGGVHRRD